MANSYVEYTTAGSGTNGLGQTTFTAPSKFLSINDIRAKGLNGSTWTELTVSARGTTTVTLSATPTSGSYSTVRIYRATTSQQIIDFQAGARLAESDLDTAYSQGLYVAQEVSEDAGAVGTLTTGVQNITLGGTTSVTNLTTTGIVQIPSGTDANHFYREGTFTPAITADATMGTVGYSHQRGYYTKIGNRVSFDIYLQYSMTGEQDVQVFVSGLPYTSSNANSGRYAASVTVGQWYNNVTKDTFISPNAWINPNSTRIILAWNNGGTGEGVVDSDLQSAGSVANIYLTGSYQIA
tara:strand:+ start:20735 stop:21619 length:885 start_codon:yes stop_codon:yes gene_type:complete